MHMPYIHAGFIGVVDCPFIFRFVWFKWKWIANGGAKKAKIKFQPKHRHEHWDENVVK